jgi:hypothetical protein
MPETTSNPVTELDEREQRIQSDYEWVLHDAKVQRQYAGQVVAVSNRLVWGTGKTHLAALEAALSRPDCPPRGDLATVAVQGLPVSPSAQ